MKLQYSFDPESGLVYVADQSGESTKFVIDGLPIREALGKLWALACQYDDMPTDTRFAVFSDENPYNKMHGLAMRQFFKSKKLA